MTMDGGERVLPCGHQVGELLELVSDPAAAPGGLAAHARTCPHCQAELPELRARWELVRQAAQAPVLTPPGLVDRVLASVRGLRGQIAAEPVEVDQERGKLRISQRTVLILARRLAGDFASAHGSVHVRAVAGDEEGLQVLVAVRFGVPVGELADQLRTHLRQGLARELGEGVPPISVHVVDVHPTTPFE
ncbi:hypothetical protein GCM10010174_51290 [Kutzneria viridogrisea]|uniref:Asp23/Gls24 family envelope stress response protein n=2 Tax=Kutzneria TaxID=43356 RepID=W5W438_9PSEU|nr:hypothetical protein [Kutzneria albida]AHH96003.1 hypothetical protein KALB_2635 [Kutzneria albida DSM 43870]MBA8928795.1 hypothetical protein [Kutzneria viridogrisea]